MPVDVDEVLDGRSRRSPRRQQASAVAAAVGLHALLVTTALALPRLAQNERKLPEYVEVHVLPATALRIERPRPTPPPEPKAPPPEPEPDPAPPPEPDPEIPVLPKEEPEPAPKPPPRPPPAPDNQPGPPGARGGAVAGAPFLGAQVTGPDGASFPYDYYLEQMLGKIRQNWLRPPVEGIETTLTFRVLHNGEIDDVEIRESSGSRAFDLAALRAVRNASPLPPLPTSYREDVLTVNLIVR
jgi:protein TonB